MNKDLLPIEAIVEKLNLPEKYRRTPTVPTAPSSSSTSSPTPRLPVRGKLILVTATTPTVSGEGKTVTSIGLVQGLEKIGKKAIITSREPSLGPVFGMKGGAAGGGRSQVEPAEKINLHFHGDFHAITSAHNLLAALIDSHLFHGNPLDLDPHAITWPRTLDMNDRALRHIIVSSGGKRDGANRHTGFVITAASEIMAIMALADSREDLRARLGRIVIGSTRSGKPVLAEDLDATGPMMALLSEAILPNLVQTTEGTPALVHCGPFANIAHGTSSVLSQQMGLRLADYVVNETGFASDLGFEKYMDIVMPSSGIKPAACVLVTTVQICPEPGRRRPRGRLRQPEKTHRHRARLQPSRHRRHQPLSQRHRRRTQVPRKILRSPRRSLRPIGGIHQRRRRRNRTRQKSRQRHRRQPQPSAPNHLHPLCLAAGKDHSRRAEGLRRSHSRAQPDRPKKN